MVLLLRPSGERRKPCSVPAFASLLCGRGHRATVEAARNGTQNTKHSFPVELPSPTRLFPAPVSKDSPQFSSWSNKDRESGTTWFKYSRKRAQKEERIHLRLIQETSFKGSLFQREAAVTAPAPHIGVTAQSALCFLL